MHIVAFLDIKLHHAACELATHAHHLAVGLALYGFVGRAQVHDAPNRHSRNHGHQDEHRANQRQTLGLPNLTTLGLHGVGIGLNIFGLIGVDGLERLGRAQLFFLVLGSGLGSRQFGLDEVGFTTCLWRGGLLLGCFILIFLHNVYLA